MSLNTQFRDLIVKDTLGIVLQTSESGEYLTDVCLEPQFERILAAIQSAYNATHVVEDDGCARPAEWDTIVREQIDPSLDAFQSTVFQLSDEVIRVRNECREAVIYAACGQSCSEIISLAGSFPWIRAYKVAIGDHIWKIRATLWRYFSNWRLAMHLGHWSPANRIQITE